MQGGNILQTLLLNVSVFESQHSSTRSEREIIGCSAKAYMSLFFGAAMDVITSTNCASFNTGSV